MKTEALYKANTKHNEMPMKRKTTVAPRPVYAFLLALCASSVTTAAATSLALSRDGNTDYGIVIAKEAKKGEERAARELAHFLRKMTGARFAITRDDTPPSPREIVLGKTNRKALADLPADLHEQFLRFFHRPRRPATSDHRKHPPVNALRGLRLS